MLKLSARQNNVGVLKLLHLAGPDNSNNFNDGATTKLNGFTKLIDKLTTKLTELNLVDYIKFVLETTELLEEYKEPTDENLARIENIKEFINIATKYKDAPAHEVLAQFLEDISLLEQQAKESEQSSQPKVTLMTIHSAKGLEFEHIFVAGLEENLFPHSRSYLDPEEMEEERRLAYVAFTRAKKRLFLSFAKQRTIFGARQDTMISRFIEELPEELVEFENPNKFGEHDGFHEASEDDSDGLGLGRKKKTSSASSTASVSSQSIQAQVGDRVKSDYFGTGTILSVDESTVKIRFDKAGVKELATEYARLIKI